jgi:endonuclease/exonuclease/phosphatase family metal-dependent hydrolase
MRFALAMLFTVVAGPLLGAAGLALAGVVTGWMISSRAVGFLISGAAAASFWLIAALIQIAGGQSFALLALTAKSVRLSGASVWLLSIISVLIAFLAGGLGGWLGGSLRQMKNTLLLVISVGIMGATLSCTMEKENGIASSPIRVLSFNIRYNNPADGENAWPNRKDMVASVVQFHGADLVGIQEAVKSQIDDLTGLLPEYKWIGVGRDDGKEAGEYSAIFYRENRFTDLQHGTFWLSAIPETAGSMGWDAACVRIVTWAKLKDKKTGKELYHFNTHFDHVGEKARQESAKLLLKKIEEMAKREPIIVTGDFNATEDSPVYEILTKGTIGQATQSRSHPLTDARYVSAHAHHGADWTFHGFETVVDRLRIDYIFVSKNVKVERHGVLSDRWNGRYPSDHLPVLAEIFCE